MITLKDLKMKIAPFENSSLRKSIFQIMNTIVPYILLWIMAWQLLSVSYWLTLITTVIASGFLVRTFIIFHDCCHHSFFRSRKWNHILGIITGILTFHPYSRWKNEHAIHHATSSNLNKRGIGDIWIMTVDEYTASSRWKKLCYRLYRNSFVMFVLGPAYMLLINNRVNPKETPREIKKSTYLTNAAILIVYGLLCWIVGWQAFLLVQLPIIYIASASGIWLFYVQHQFENSYFENEGEWDYVQAALKGSSYYKLPRVLQWLTGNIGFHHIHHLSPRVPNYHLERAHKNTPELQKATTITILSSLRASRLRLWDEERKMFISFREMKRPVIRTSLKKASIKQQSPVA